MNRTAAQSLLEQELAHTLELGYERIRRHIGGEPITKEVLGPDGRGYQIEICAYWDNHENGPVRLVLSIDDGGWRAFFPLTADCVVDPS
jgi:hypothetical protein